MSPEAINIAIAEHLGWKGIQKGWTGSTVGSSPFSQIMRHSNLDPIPNYRGDLNPCHEAVRSLTDEQREDFRQQLSRIWVRDYNSRCGLFPSHNDSVNATAAQRCEAFLRAVGKWKGGEG